MENNFQKYPDSGPVIFLKKASRHANGVLPEDFIERVKHHPNYDTGRTHLRPEGP